MSSVFWQLSNASNPLMVFVLFLMVPLILFDALKSLYKRFIEPTKKYASVIVEVDINYVMHPIHIDKSLR